MPHDFSANSESPGHSSIEVEQIATEAIFLIPYCIQNDRKKSQDVKFSCIAILQTGINIHVY